LGRVPTNVEVKEEVRRLKAQKKEDREDARHACAVGNAMLEEWRLKMEEGQEDQYKKLETLETLLREFISDDGTQFSKPRTCRKIQYKVC
jgi:hypothetical protein